MPFRTALSGLNAASADLRVTGNNMDLALSGRGFFVLDDGGARSYTREGAFQVDREGYVINSAGKRLQAYPVQDQLNDTFNTGTLADLRLSTTEAPPQATSRVEAAFNLASGTDDLSGVAFDAMDPATYDFTTSLKVYDSLGESHTAELYFRGAGGLDWESYLSIDGVQIGGAAALEFGADGLLTQPTAPINFGAFVPANGAEPVDIEFDFTSATQFGSSHNVDALRQDGYASGRLTGVDIDASGVASARFTNGQSLSLGQVAVASFSNPQGLQQVGENAWVETFAAGDPLYGVAGQGDFGLVQSGGLESSNVDIAEQLVNLITAQRNFQANSQVISTADAVTQTIINIR